MFPYVYPFPTDHAVIDGDSLRLYHLDLGFYHEHRILIARLFGVDTPEMKTAAGRRVKHVVEDLLTLADLKKSFIHSLEIPDSFHNRFIARVLLYFPIGVIESLRKHQPLSESFKSPDQLVDLSQLLLYLQLGFYYEGESKSGLWTPSRLEAARNNADIYLNRSPGWEMPCPSSLQRIVDA